MLLFVTNVTAILAVGSVVMAIYKVRTTSGHTAQTATPARSRRRSPLVIAVTLVLIAIPLTGSSAVLITQRPQQGDVYAASQEWAHERNWEVIGITTREGETVVRLTGPLPIPDSNSLRDSIAEAGVDVTAVRAEFIPSEAVDFSDG